MSNNSKSPKESTSRALLEEYNALRLVAKRSDKQEFKEIEKDYNGRRIIQARNNPNVKLGVQDATQRPESSNTALNSSGSEVAALSKKK